MDSYTARIVSEILPLLETLPGDSAGIGFECSDGRSYIEVCHRPKSGWSTSRREGHRYDVRHPAGHGRTLGPLQYHADIQAVAVYLADRVDLAACTAQSFDRFLGK
jgi:hypothetical protein